MKEAKLFIQSHVHTNRSFDSNTSVGKYVEYFSGYLKKEEFGIIGIADHNVIPLSVEKALLLSNKKVAVIPGIQWRLHKSFSDSIKKLCTRREIITLGDHGDLRAYIEDKTSYKISEKDEILGHFYEEEFLNYLSHNPRITIIVPHPRHFFFEFYGRSEIKILKDELRKRGIKNPFFIEEKTGYDPFPRIFYSYKNEYSVLGSSDAHQIYSFLGTPSFFSTITYLPCSPEFLGKWEPIFNKKDILSYKNFINLIFKLIKGKNSEIQIKKYYIRTILQFSRSIPLWFFRRFENFPRNLFK